MLDAVPRMGRDGIGWMAEGKEKARTVSVPAGYDDMRYA